MCERSTATEEMAPRDTFNVTVPQCRECSLTLPSPEAVCDHYWHQHADQRRFPAPIACGDCGEIVDTQDDLTHHESDHIPDEFAPCCAQCESEFDSVEQAETHFWDAHAHETDVFEAVVCCPACDWHGESEWSLVSNHVSDAHSLATVFTEATEGIEDDSECPVCGDTLADHTGLLQHATSKHSVDALRQYHCTLCGDTVPGSDSATEHVREKHADDIAHIITTHRACPECDTTAYAENIAEHYAARHIADGQRVCPECDESAALSQQSDAMRRHYWAVHHDGADPVEIRDRRHVDRSEALECLYNINKHAKKYAELGTENYRNGKKTTAKANSLKKDALYTLKEHVLAQIYEETESIKLHRIDGNEFYLFDFGEYSFHTPVENLALPDVSLGESTVLDDFESGSEKEHSDKSLKACLLFFEQEFGLNANEFLGRKFLSYGRQSHFIGWKYLGDDT